MAGIPIGPYQILRTLGAGAHSTILHIRRGADLKSYALKVVTIGGAKEHKFLKQARHEYEIAQQLDHPNLVKIFALEQERDWLLRVRKVHLLIEYVNGQTVDTIKKPLSLPQLVQIFARLADALLHMHKCNIYHSDLKPNNILLSRAGEVKVIDYGLARVKGADTARVQGTPEYMAPEQAKHGSVNERTDIYNLGATMYRLVTGYLPPATVVEADGLPMTAKLWESRLKPVEEYRPEAPAELIALIKRCLAYNPQHRAERMSEVQGALDRLAVQLVRSPEDRLEAFEW